MELAKKVFAYRQITSDCWWFAVIGGHFETFKWLCEQDDEYRYLPHYAQVAAEHKKRDILDWLWDNFSDDWSRSEKHHVCKKAATYMPEWFKSKNIENDYQLQIVEYAAKTGDLERIRNIESETGYPFQYEHEVSRIAIANDHFQIAEFANCNCVECAARAAYVGDLATLRRIYKNAPRVIKHAFRDLVKEEAVCGGKMHIIKFLIDEVGLRFTQRNFYLTVMHGYLDVIDFIHKCNPVVAIFDKHCIQHITLEILQWADENAVSVPRYLLELHSLETWKFDVYDYLQTNRPQNASKWENVDLDAIITESTATTAATVTSYEMVPFGIDFTY